jgi:hypothetical protein
MTINKLIYIFDYLVYICDYLVYICDYLVYICELLLVELVNLLIGPLNTGIVNSIILSLSSISSKLYYIIFRFIDKRSK